MGLDAGMRMSIPAFMDVNRAFTMHMIVVHVNHARHMILVGQTVRRCLTAW